MNLTLPYTPRRWQATAHKSIDAVRFAVLVWHRRAGKTVACINELIKGTVRCPYPNARGIYVAPFLKQAKKVAWQYLLDYTAPIPGVRYNKSDLSATFPNGAVVYLGGADNPDSLRGIHLDFAVLDEYAQMSPMMWTSVLRPALSDRKGKAIMIGTPQGRNSFYKMYKQAGELDGWYANYLPVTDTDCIDAAELLALQREMPPDEYEREYLLNWDASIQGAFFGSEMQDAHSQGRITSVPYESGLPVVSAWDLGIRNSVVWLFQIAGTEVRVIDCRFYEGTSLEAICRDLDKLPYIWNRHILPHDVRVREFGTGRTRLEMMQTLGMDVQIAKNLPELDGIEAARRLIERCWFDADACELGIEALTQFRTEYDPTRQSFKLRPLEDWTNHFADAFRYFAIENGGVQMDMQLGWRDPIDYGGRNASIT